MEYSLCVATDFDGAKLNLQFFFPYAAPTVAEALNAASFTYANLFRAKGVNRPFSITTAVIFNETHLTWDRLERSSQLVHNGQLYLFQPDLVDLPGDIPDPVPAEEYVDTYVPPQPSTLSPIRTYGSNTGVNISPSRTTYATAEISPPTRQRSLSTTRQHYSTTHNYQDSNNTYTRTISSSQQRGGGNYISSNLNDSEEMIRAFHKRQESPATIRDYDGDSIIQDERRRLAEQSRLSLDDYRDVARKEAREYSPETSPSRLLQ